MTHHETIADESLYNGPDAPLPGADTSGWEWDQDAVEKKAFVSILAKSLIQMIAKQVQPYEKMVASCFNSIKAWIPHSSRKGLQTLLNFLRVVFNSYLKIYENMI